MAAVVAAVDQRYWVPPEAVRVTDPPLQNVVGPDGVIAATGVVAGVQVPLTVMLSRYSIFPWALTPRNLSRLTDAVRLTVFVAH